MSFRSQLLKGIMDGCVLAVIEKETVYGYELSKKLQDIGLSDVSEGTIYPVLLRLQKNGLIHGEMKPSESGPNRKYYYLTDAGKMALETITLEWEQVFLPVHSLFQRRNNNESKATD
ncbi:PadR family transcriptional regulator [Bacillus coreaensis]